MNIDLLFIKQALRLAEKARGRTNPNPMVGCVIVKEGKVIAHGLHKKIGLAHAEAEALAACDIDPGGSTLYVNLEPCSHFGRTPPCVNAIINAGITRVVCSRIDPNPKVRGKGINALQKAGIEVSVGALEKESLNLNEAYITFYEKKRPFIALKFAASLDGKIATRTGDSKWITNEKARRYARKLRGVYQSVLVGINTVLHDDPHLGTREKSMKDPLRIIIDSTLKIPLDSRVLRDTNVLIATTIQADQMKKDVLQKKGIEIISSGSKKISLNFLLEELVKREVISILVEGGGGTIGGFVDKKLFDKVYAFHAPLIIGGKNAVTAVEGEGVPLIADAIRLKNISLKRFDDCLLTIGYPDLS